MKRFLILYKELRRYAKTPEALPLLILLTLTAVLLIINIFFVSALLKFLTVVLFFGVIIATTNGYARLARLRVRGEFKARELQAIHKSLEDGVVIYDENFKVISLNRAAEEIFALKTGDVVGKHITPELIKNLKFKLITQVIFPSLAPVATKISGDAWPQKINLVFENPPLKLRTALNHITDEKGNVIGFLKLVHDETREKEIIQSKVEFITITAHQLRTPLTAIKWSFESLSKALGEKPELKKLTDDGLGLSERILKTVNDLLDAAKIEEGKFGYTFKETELVAFISQVIGYAKQVAEKYGTEIIFNSPEREYKLKIDPERLGVALSNFLDNAIRYNTKKSNITISLEESKDKSFIQINITDNGIGVPPQETNRLFKKFYRGSNAVKVEPNGSGLGLYIAKNIIKHHGGNVGVRSQLGRGSTFWFTIPLDPNLIPQKEIAKE